MAAQFPEPEIGGAKGGVLDFVRKEGHFGDLADDPWPLYFPDGQIYSFAVGDYDGDGKWDMAGCDYKFMWDANIWLRTRVDVPLESISVYQRGKIASTNVDNDDFWEIFKGTEPTPFVPIEDANSVMFATDMGAYPGPAYSLWRGLGANFDLFPEHVYDLGDFDGDGSGDILIIYSPFIDAQIHVVDAALGREVIHIVDPNPSIFHYARPLGDMDGDGKAEIGYIDNRSLWAIHDDGTREEIYHMGFNGTGFASLGNILPNSPTEEYVLTGSNNIDVIEWDSGTSSWIKNSDLSVQMDVGGVLQTVGDLDGDAVPDLVMFDSSTSTVIIHSLFNPFNAISKPLGKHRIIGGNECQAFWVPDNNGNARSEIYVGCNSDGDQSVALEFSPAMWALDANGQSTNVGEDVEKIIVDFGNSMPDADEIRILTSMNPGATLLGDIIAPLQRDKYFNYTLNGRYHPVCINLEPLEDSWIDADPEQGCIGRFGFDFGPSGTPPVEFQGKTFYISAIATRQVSGNTEYLAASVAIPLSF